MSGSETCPPGAELYVGMQWFASLWLLSMPVLFLSLPTGEFEANKVRGPKRRGEDRRTWFDHRWSLPVSVATFCRKRREEMGLPEPSWKQQNSTVAVCLTGEFHVLSSRGDLHQAAQRQWADYICLKDNAVIQHICWARVERVIPLPNPSPHSVKGR